VNEEEKLRQQMASIGSRYLTRTLGELRRIADLHSQAEAGTPTAMKELEHAAHKIHGSGAMFGFHDVSDRARDVELIAGHLVDGSGPEDLRALDQVELRRRLATAVEQLDHVTRSTAQSQGINPDVG
jgi:chemotaxis protein histidine kinase CheA